MVIINIIGAVIVGILNLICLIVLIYAIAYNIYSDRLMKKYRKELEEFIQR